MHGDQIEISQILSLLILILFIGATKKPTESFYPVTPDVTNV